MYVPRHARHGGADRVLHPLAGGVGEYSEGTRGRTAIVCAREWCGHARPAAPRIRYSNGSRSNGLSSSLLAGYSEGTRGVLTGPCVEPSARGSGRRRAGHSQRGRTEYEHARGYCQRYRVPHGAGPLPGAAAGVLTATCGEGTRTSVRRCVRAHAGALTDTSASERSHAGARHGVARAAGAQSSKLLELRQRVRDRAVERVRGKIPATCMVRPAVQ